MPVTYKLMEMASCQYQEVQTLYLLGAKAGAGYRAIAAIFVLWEMCIGGGPTLACPLTGTCVLQDFGYTSCHTNDFVH